MNADSKPPVPALPAEARSESDAPDVEALLAGTLALMTGYGDATCRHLLRPCMAAKISANLEALATHPRLSPAFRSVLAGLQSRWAGCVGAPPHAPGRASSDVVSDVLRHAAPAAVQ